MTAIQTSNKLSAKLLLLVAIMAGMLALLLALGWWAGETAAKRLDADMREQLLRQAEGIARAVNPELAKKLTFTEADKGSPAFETLRKQFIAAGKTGSQRGIYSMALRDGKIIFGPESYPKNDPMASPPGTVYKKPNPENRQVLQTGKPMVAARWRTKRASAVEARPRKRWSRWHTTKRCRPAFTNKWSRATESAPPDTPTSQRRRREAVANQGMIKSIATPGLCLIRRWPAIPQFLKFRAWQTRHSGHDGCHAHCSLSQGSLRPVRPDRRGHWRHRRTLRHHGRGPGTGGSRSGATP